MRVMESAYHAYTLKPYRVAERAERRLEQANVNLLYQKHVQDNPQDVWLYIRKYEGETVKYFLSNAPADTPQSNIRPSGNDALVN